MPVASALRAVMLFGSVSAKDPAVVGAPAAEAAPAVAEAELADETSGQPGAASQQEQDTGAASQQEQDTATEEQENAEKENAQPEKENAPPPPPRVKYVYAPPAPPAEARARTPRANPPDPVVRVVCYLCGRAAGTKSIRFHHAKCVARWTDGPLPFPPSLDAIPDAAGPELDAYNARAKTAFDAHSTCACKLCGKRIRRVDATRHLRDDCVNRRPTARKPPKRGFGGGDSRKPDIPECNLDNGGAPRIPLPAHPMLRETPRSLLPAPAPRVHEAPPSPCRRAAAKDPRVLERRRAAALLRADGKEKAARAELRQAAQAEASLVVAFRRKRHGDKKMAGRLR